MFVFLLTNGKAAVRIGNRTYVCIRRFVEKRGKLHMLITNFFFWVMLFLLSSLIWLLFDAYARAEKHTLQELRRLACLAGEPSGSESSDRSRLNRRLSGGPVIADRQPCMADRNQPQFFDVGPVSGISGPSRQDIDTCAYEIPRAAGLGFTQRNNEKAVVFDCPSCA